MKLDTVNLLAAKIDSLYGSKEMNENTKLQLGLAGPSMQNWAKQG